MTFEEFKNYWRDYEARFGTRMIAYTYAGQPAIGADAPRSDEELREMYEHLKSEEATGVVHHGTITTKPVLDFAVL